MQTTDSILATFGRSLGGMFAGFFIGFLLEGPCFCFSEHAYMPPEDRWLLLIVPLICAVIFGIAAAFFSSYELRGSFKVVSASSLAGIMVGLIFGLVLNPAVLEVLNESNPVLHDKLAYRANLGAVLGMIVGALLGAMVGFIIWILHRRCGNKSAQGNALGSTVQERAEP